MKYVMLLLWAFMGSLHAAPDLLVPLYTKHIQYGTSKDYVEGFDNTSIGLNWSFDHADVGSAWVSKNSYGKSSVYGYALGYLNSSGIKVGAGAYIAVGGYNIPLLISPVLALRYKYVRVTTTYPLGKLSDAGFDLLNVQLLIPLEF